MLVNRIPLTAASNAFKSSTFLRPSSIISCSRQCLQVQKSNMTLFALRSNVRQNLGVVRIQKRSESTIASAAAGATSTSTAQQPLTWSRFLELRKVRRKFGLMASIACALASFAAGTYFIGSTPDIENKIAQYIGIDPIITMGIMTFACGAAGWLVGPFIGGAVFSLQNRSMMKLIAQKEREFFFRIKKYRVDPTTSSLGNPVPDYYGEKIGSLKDYRRWLKDQRAFNLKRDKNML